MSPDPRLASRISADPQAPAQVRVDPVLAAVQRERFDSLALLAGSVAHDFNNLLTAILGHAELAMMQIPAGSGARYQVERIAVGARRAADLAGSLLTFAGRGPVVLEAVDLVALVEETVRLLKASTPAAAAVACLPHPGGLPVRADAVQIRRTLTLLIGQALRRRGEDPGPIQVRCGVRVLDQAWLGSCLVATGAPGSYACVEIAGPSPERQDWCADFVPYALEGSDLSGLGIPSILGVARAHGGAVRLQGATLAFLLPVAEEAPAAEVEPQPGPALSRERCVLVVDDEESVREVVREILTRSGYRVLVAADGAEAVEIFTALGRDIHGVLLDMTMPRMNGAATFRALRAQRPDVRVLLMSGYSEVDSRARFGEQGLAGFVQKPFAARTLLSALESALAEG